MAGKKAFVDFSGVTRQIDDLKRLRPLLVKNLQYAGELYVKTAREDGNYKDRTGNLRASVGYELVDEGSPVARTGSKDAQKLLSTLRGGNPKGLRLNMCAAMEYASCVESRGYNVDTSARQRAGAYAKEALDKVLKGGK